MPVLARRLALTLVLVASLARADFPAGVTTTVSLAHGGSSRSYDVYAPTGYDGSTPVPLLLDFHVLGGTPSGEAGMSNLHPLADANGFLVAYPAGLGSWNAGACCAPASTSGVDDVGFAKAVVADVAAQANVDLTRVYATGLSNGAGMAHRLGCEASDVFAAVVAVSAPLVVTPLTSCAPPRPMPVLHFACINDTIVPYGGGPVTIAGGVVVPSAQESFARWVAVDGCTGPSSIETFPSGATCEIYDACAGGVRTGLCSLYGSHFLYSNTDGVDVGQRSWDFLSSFTLTGSVSTTSVASTSTSTTTLPSIARCGATPVAGCLETVRMSLVVNEKTVGREKLKATMQLGAVGAADLGAPVGGGTRYAVCLYDEVPQLVAEMYPYPSSQTCGKAPCWKAAGTGVKYTDARAAADGIKSLIAKPGAAGRAKIVVKGFNRMPDIRNLPTGVASRLARGGTSVGSSVQVLSSDAACFAGTARTVPGSGDAVYKAKTP